MRAAATSLTLGFLLLVSAGETQALGFGRVINVSTLGQPLNFAAAVRLEPGESLVRECVSAEVQSGDAKLPAAAIRLTLEPGADASERLVRITTLTPIDEPVATVNITAGCIPSLSRSFVTLIDPPLVNLAQGGAAPPTLPPQRIESSAAPAVAVAQAASAQEAAAPRAPREAAAAPRPRPPRPAIAAAPRAATVDVDAPRPRRATPAPARVAAPARTPGPRLKLEQVAPVVTAAASAPRPGEALAAAEAAASAASAAAAAAAASAASAVEAEQRRFAAMEQSVAALRETTASTQKALAELQGRLKEAEAARYANPLVYALAVLAAFLSVVVALLWWRQSHARGGSQWWLAPAAGPATGTGPLRPGVPRRSSIDLASGAAKLETEPAVMDDRANRAIIEDMPRRIQPAAVVTPPPPAPMTATVPPPDPPVLRRELSVEELIDLEQQADFFVVLGQDEAAIDLLMGHVRSSGGISPLPYLKLLEIYRRRGEREAYERVRERFNRRFNAYAPDWDADLQHGKSLDDYPKVLVRLQRFWDEPSRVTALLDESLMRHGDAGESFELPAYRELLFLYSIARDLAEHPAAATGVDLLLPLEVEAHETPIERLSASRMMGFAPTLAPDPGPPHVDLDVTRPAPVDDAPPSDFLGLVGDRPKKGKG